MKYPTKSIAAPQGNNLNAKKVAISAFAAPKNTALWPRSSPPTAKNRSLGPRLSSHDAAGLSPGEAETKSWPCGDYGFNKKLCE